MSHRRSISKSKRGRPHGRLSLRTDKRRFEVAAFFCATELMGYAPYPAAYLVCFLFSDRPIDVHSLAKGFTRLSSEVGNNATLAGRAGSLVDKCRFLKSEPALFDWLPPSAAGLRMLVTHNDPKNYLAAVRLVIDELDFVDKGWRSTLLRIISRIDTAIATSNMSPLEQTMSANTARFVEDLQRRAEILSKIL